MVGRDKKSNSGNPSIDREGPVHIPASIFRKFSGRTILLCFLELSEATNKDANMKRKAASLPIMTYSVDQPHRECSSSHVTTVVSCQM